MFSLKFNLFAALTLAAIFSLSGCSKMDPNETISEKNLSEAKDSFSDLEIMRIKALGEQSYLIGKTVNSVRKQLPSDYRNYEIGVLVSNEKLSRKFNLETSAAGKLSAKNIRLDASSTDKERNLALSEIKTHEAYLKKVEDVRNEPLGMGTVVVGKGSLTCRRVQDIEEILLAEEKSVSELKRVQNRKVRRKECYVAAKDSKYKIRDERKLSSGTEIIFTVRGWIPKTDLKSLPTQQEIEELQAEKTATLEHLKSAVPPQFFYTFRPLLQLSSDDAARIALAKKAVVLNMAEFGEDWKQASARLVKEQKAFAASEYECRFESNCEENERLNRRMADYSLSSDIEGIKKGELPCEILRSSKCRRVRD